MPSTTRLTCSCGQVAIDMEGAPILSVECCCTSCRTASTRFEQLPGAPRIQTEHGTTPFVMVRKDRIQWVAGTSLLEEHRLSPKAPSRRVIATCCNTPVFLEFSGGHWLSLYGQLWPDGTRPPLEMRTMAKDLPAGVTLPNDVPNAGSQSATFMFKLLGAWIAMGFRAPKLDFVGGSPSV
jgi:hypothetical protein